MKTNREKYEHYCAEIAAKDQQAIAALIPVAPTMFYCIQGFEAVPHEVTGIGVYRRGIYQHDADDRVTRDEVELAKKCLDDWTPPALQEISVHYKYKMAHGSTVSGAFIYQNMVDDKHIAWRAEDLASEIERKRELYAPRDRHTACGYCRKQHPTASLISRTIYYRDQGGSRTKAGQYCSEQCGYYDQCGHEG